MSGIGKPKMDADLPPHSDECENGLIAALIGNRQGIADAYALGIRDDAFYTLATRHVWQALRELDAHGEPVEAVAVAKKLMAQGRWEGVIQNTTCLTKDEAVPGMIPWFCEEVLKAWVLRRVIQASSEAVAAAKRPNANPSEVVLALEEKIEEAKHHAKASTRTAKEVCRSWIDRIQQRQDDRSGGKELMGIPTGFPRLDSMSSGLLPATLTVIGARPSVGKTAMLCNLIRHAAIQERVPTTVISLETLHETLMDRMAADVCRIDGRKLRDGEQLNEDEMRRLTAFNAKVASAPLTWSVDVFDSAGICSMIGRHADAGTQLFLIDYLQIIAASGSYERKAYSVGSVATSLKHAALRHKVAVVVLAQLRRPESEDKPPTSNDIADSDQIFRDADVLWLLHRPDRISDPTNGIVIVEKNKEGETSAVPMHYAPSNFRWTENINNTPDHDAK